MLKIVGRQVSRNSDETETIEFITEGKYDEADGVVYLQYEESDLSGMEGCTTHLTIMDDNVRMHRSGDILPLDTVLEFRRGCRSTSLYQTPFGAIEMEVLTNSLVDRISRQWPGGSLNIDYDVSLRGLTESRSQIKIEIINRPRSRRKSR
ncbi:MAG TPA: DUF1934 domain-containing protein [Clostridiales bacterium]|jgi:uncharacterized beta-barrel protein YwiB (DUF1934 family)|nr:DUF1934 domain-containing protein [Clostridiales bacterium]